MKKKSWLEVFKHSVHGGTHAKGCRLCGVRWKVYQKFPGHNPGCPALKESQ
jgi:hypothetical protein